MQHHQVNCSLYQSLLILWSRILLDKLIVIQLVKKFHTF